MAPSLKLIRDFGNVYHVNLLGLILQVAKLNEEGEKMINSVYENPEWFKGEIKFYRRVLERKLQQKKSRAPQTIMFTTLHPRQVEYSILCGVSQKDERTHICRYDL